MGRVVSWVLLREAEADETLGKRQLGRKVVLMYLARRADDRGITKIGSRIIAEDTGTDHRRVRRLLNELCDMGRVDLVVRGRNGRGHAHTWRVLSMAEWIDRKDRKEGVESASTPDGKGGVEDTQKGATSPPPEQSPTSPPLPPAERGESDHRIGAQGRRAPRPRRSTRRADEARQRQEAERQARKDRDASIEDARRRHDQEEAERDDRREECLALARAVREQVRSRARVRPIGGRP
jgi:type IV secretory pathway VirB10-like protein